MRGEGKKEKEKQSGYLEKTKQGVSKSLPPTDDARQSKFVKPKSHAQNKPMIGKPSPPHSHTQYSPGILRLSIEISIPRAANNTET
jgi:hypothetical protein